MVARGQVRLPEELRLLDPQSLEQALLLEDATSVQRLRAVLGYMGSLCQSGAAA
jgi:hypothetical protein